MIFANAARVLANIVLRPKQYHLEVQLRYTADETISLTCRQNFGIPLKKLYYILSIYSPRDGSLLLRRHDVFGEFSSGVNHKAYTKERQDEALGWFIIHEVAQFEPSNRPLQIPWIFEYSTQRINGISFQYAKSDEFTLKYFFHHIPSILDRYKSRSVIAD